MVARKTKAKQATRQQQEQAAKAMQRYTRIAVLSIVGMALLGSIIWGGLWLRDPGNLPLKHVEIHGDFTYLTQADLSETIGPIARGGFFSVDVAAVQRVAEELPWVARATVRRIWPDKLEVHAIEQVAMARWGEKSLLNAQGDVFTPATLKGVPVLPQLLGPEALRERVIRLYAEAVRLMTPIEQQVVQIELDERRAWRLQLASDVELELGRGDVDARLRRIVAVYPQLIASQETDLLSIDMRYSNGFAVRWNATQES